MTATVQLAAHHPGGQMSSDWLLVSRHYGFKREMTPCELTSKSRQQYPKNPILSHIHQYSMKSFRRLLVTIFRHSSTPWNFNSKILKGLALVGLKENATLQQGLLPFLTEQWTDRIQTMYHTHPPSRPYKHHQWFSRQLMITLCWNMSESSEVAWFLGGHDFLPCFLNLYARRCLVSASHPFQMGFSSVSYSPMMFQQQSENPILLASSTSFPMFQMLTL